MPNLKSNEQQYENDYLICNLIGHRLPELHPQAAANSTGSNTGQRVGYHGEYLYGSRHPRFIGK